jgi:hypothetical protein
LFELEKLYSSSDGSRGIIERIIKTTPTRYARFHKVGKIEVRKVYRLGNYFMVIVSWYSKNDEYLTDWTELVYCESSCFMSERLMRPNDEIAFYVSAVGGESSSVGLADSDYKINIEYPKNGKVVKIGLALKNLHGDQNKSFNTVVEMMRTLKSNNNKIGSLADGSIDVWGKLTRIMFDSYWLNFNKKSMYYYPNPRGSNTLFSALDRVTLANRLSQVEQVSPIAFLKGHEVEFILVEVIRNNKKELLQFYISSAGMIINQSDLSGEDSGIAQLLQNKFVYEKLLDLSSDDDAMKIINDDRYQIDLSGMLLNEKAGVEDNGVETDVSNEFSIYAWLVLSLIVFLILLLSWFIFLRRKAS